MASTPGTAGLYRLDSVVASLARRTLWLTDAYFAGTASYVQALRAAAKDGVDKTAVAERPRSDWIDGREQNGTDRRSRA